MFYGKVNLPLKWSEIFTALNMMVSYKAPHSVILRSGATKNLNDTRFFAIAQNDRIAHISTFYKALNVNQLERIFGIFAVVV